MPKRWRDHARGTVPAPSALLLGLLLAAGTGCPSGKIISVDAVAPDSPELELAVVSDGFSHVAERCEVEILLGDYWCLQKIPIKPTAPDPQQVAFRVNEWQPWSANTDRRRVAPAKELMRVRFLYNRSAVMDEQFYDRPKFTPYPPGRPPVEPVAQKPPKAESGEERTTRNVLDAGGTKSDPGRRLSRDPGNPTPIEFKDGKAVVLCKVAGSSTPQYARLEPSPGNVKLIIQVRSTDAPGQSTWWRLELLDKVGNPLPEPIQEFQFIETGNHARAEVTWAFDGTPHILKLSSGSEQGDDIRIDMTSVDSRIPE